MVIVPIWLAEMQSVILGNWNSQLCQYVLNLEMLHILLMEQQEQQLQQKDVPIDDNQMYKKLLSESWKKYLSK